MAGRLAPVGHYNLNGGNPLIVSALHDLNTVDSRNGEIEGIADGDGNGHTGDSLDQEEDTDSADCVPHSYGHSLQLQGVGVESDHSLPLDSEEPPRSPYGVLTAADVLPIEASRSRFLKLLLSNFIIPHMIPSSEPVDSAYNNPNGKDKQKKRKTRDVQYEGDPKYVLPLAYVANLYETLVNEVNARLSTIDNVHEKTMGVALEAAGGLYRRLVKLYPKSGSTCNFKRREMASATEARNRFPHLVTGEEKRVRFVVVHGLELVEHPNMPYEDVEWFKRLTGRHEAVISERDYKFFSPRHKYRRATQHSLANVQTIPNFVGVDTSGLATPQSLRAVALQYSSDPMNLTTRSSPQHQLQHQSHSMQCHPEHQPSHPSAHQQQQQQVPHLSRPPHSSHGSHLADPLHAQNSSPNSPHLTRGMHPPSAFHVGGRVVVMPSQLAKYCDECGAPYLRETSKYCSECGTRRAVLTGP